VGITPVNAPRKVEEELEIPVGGDRQDLHGQMAPRSLLTARKASRTRSMWTSVWVAI